MALNKDKSFQQMSGTDEIVLQPESITKKFQVDNIINIVEREKQLREAASSNSITSVGREEEYCYSWR